MSIEISDSAVEAALNSGLNGPRDWKSYCRPESRQAIFDDMKMRLSAALPLIVGEPVAWVRESFLEKGSYASTCRRDYPPDDTVALHGPFVPLYAIKQGASRE